jgi:hypothetical protein
VRISNRQFRVIGTLERRGSSFEGSIDNLAAIPIQRWSQLYGKEQSANVTVMVRDPDRIGVAQDEVVASCASTAGRLPRRRTTSTCSPTAPCRSSSTR